VQPNIAGSRFLKTIDAQKDFARIGQLQVIELLAFLALALNALDLAGVQVESIEAIVIALMNRFVDFTLASYATRHRSRPSQFRLL
jgi:hypothetical protein